METSAANLDTVEKTGEDFVIHLAGAFLEMTVKEKRYGIQTKNVRKDQRVGAVAGGRQRSLKGPKYNYEVLRLNQGFHSLTEVKNNAGGWVFNISEEQRVRRFLILGSTSPTWYSPAQKLTVQNLDGLISIINNGKAAMILKEIYEISLAGRNPKQEPTMMALALCARYRVHDMTHFGNKQSPDVQRYMAYLQSMHKAAMRIVNDVCRIPTHLFMFIKYCEDVSKWTNANFDQKSSGWGRMMRASISNWYGSKSVDQLALHLTKYRSRDGWSHRDLFRLAHPKSEKHAQVEEHRLEVEQLYHYAAKGTLNTRKLKLKDEEFKLEEPGSKYSMTQMENELKSSALDMVQVFTYINQWTPEQDIVFAIHRYKLVREHIPTEHLNNPDIWRALLCEMPFTALVRNLGKIAAVKALDKVYVELIVNQLTNEQQIKKSRIHPLQILLAKLIYKSGSGEKGSNSWIPDPRVDQALEDAFYLSFVNALPTGKRICFAYDISGSMSARIAGTHLSCRTASAALSLISLKNEENTHCVGFSHELIKLPYDGTWNIAKIEKHMAKLPFGKTDCALPMIYAKRRSLKIDVFVVYTDNETFYGAVHPFKALQDYRKTSGIHDAKLIVMGMTATNFSIADPSDPGMLDIIGLDSSVPQLIHEFVIGRL